MLGTPAPALPAPGRQPGIGANPASRLAALAGTRLHADRRGRVRLLLRCAPAIACHGAVSLAALLTVNVGHGRHRHRHVVHVALVRATFGPHRGQFVLTLKLPRKARALLRRHHGKLRVAVTIAASRKVARTVDATLSG